jgi:hypothetical protein
VCIHRGECMHVYVSICVCTVFLKKKIHGTQPNLSRLKIWGPQPSQLDNESYVRVLLYLQLAGHFLLISVKVIIEYFSTCKSFSTNFSQGDYSFIELLWGKKARTILFKN